MSEEECAIALAWTFYVSSFSIFHAAFKSYTAQTSAALSLGTKCNPVKTIITKHHRLSDTAVPSVRPAAQFIGPCRRWRSHDGSLRWSSLLPFPLELLVGTKALSLGSC